MLHHGQGLPFGLKASDDLARVHTGPDQLQRHLAADRLGLLRQKTTPMPPSPIRSSSRYGPMTVPGPSAGGRSHGGPFGAGRRRFQEAARISVNPQQAVDPVVQDAIGPAGLPQVGLAFLLALFLDGRDEDLARSSPGPHATSAASSCVIRGRIAERCFRNFSARCRRAASAGLRPGPSRAARPSHRPRSVRRSWVRRRGPPPPA